MIHDLFDFLWPELIKKGLTKRDQSWRYACHKDHGHTTKQCKSLYYSVERLIKVKHLKQYVCAIGGQRETTRDLAIQAPTTSVAPRVVINYIHRSPANEKYNSKWKRQRLFCVASLREWISFIQHNFPERSMRPVDSTITSPPINANRVLQPHEDALILTLGISGFNVWRVLIDPGSSTDLLQMSTNK